MSRFVTVPAGPSAQLDACHVAQAKAGLPTEARSPSRERRLVAREGLEPSKPQGRQIYSLLRLTASLPRQLSVFVGGVMFLGAYLRLPMELAKGFEPPTG